MNAFRNLCFPIMQFVFKHVLTCIYYSYLYINLLIGDNDDPKKRSFMGSSVGLIQSEWHRNLHLQHVWVKTTVNTVNNWLTCHLFTQWQCFSSGFRHTHKWTFSITFFSFRLVSSKIILNFDLIVRMSTCSFWEPSSSVFRTVLPPLGAFTWYWSKLTCSSN